MKSSNELEARRKRISQIVAMLVAIGVSIAMWYIVSVRDRLEAQVEINIDYFGIPPNLVITDGLVNKITVRLRGPETLLRSIPRERLTEAINLSSIKKGVTIVPLGRDELGPAFRAFEIVDIQPPRIVVRADTLMERTVPVRPIVDSPLRNGALTMENLSVSPATVILRGPEQVISGIANVPLTITLDPKAAGTTVQKSVTLDTPSLVTANPPSVRVRYTITSGRTVVSRRCQVVIGGDMLHLYDVAPKEITVLVEVPDALAKNASYLGQMEVSVAPPDLGVGESGKFPVRFRLPEGMSLLNPVNEEVTITRIKK